MGAAYLGIVRCEPMFPSCDPSQASPSGRVRGMTSKRRFVAFLAAFAVLATALWPLATSLGFAASGEAVPLCHQAGLQVAADSMPMPEMPGEPAAPAKSHCPLCVLVFFAAFAPELAPPPYVEIG